MHLQLHLSDETIKRWRPLAEPCRLRLQAERITHEGPGTILKDVREFLEFVAARRPRCSAAKPTIPPELLPELNQRLSHPVELHVTRALVKDYPNIAGIFVLLRILGLITPRDGRLTVPEAALSEYQRLNPAEQYFALLETLLFRTSRSALGVSARFQEEILFEILAPFLANFRDKWINFACYDLSRIFSPTGDIPPMVVFLLQQFGILQLRSIAPGVEPRGDSGGRSWMPGGAKLTDWGTAVSWALLTELHRREEEEEEVEQDDPQEDDEWQDDADWAADEEQAPYGALHPVFQPFFPELLKTYSPLPAQNLSGTLIFKVAIKAWRAGPGIWKRIAAESHASLDGFAYEILKAFNFDDTDHAYYFRYRDDHGRTRIYYHPNLDEGPWADQVTLGKMELPIGGKMKYLFDFGDNWEFEVTLEKLVPESTPGTFQVLESHGEAPSQYS